MRAGSQKLRATVTAVCNQAVTEIKHAWAATNQSMQDRIRETEETQKKLQTHLNKTLQEIKDQEKHIEQLRVAVRSKGERKRQSTFFRKLSQLIFRPAAEDSPGQASHEVEASS